MPHRPLRRLHTLTVAVSAAALAVPLTAPGAAAAGPAAAGVRAGGRVAAAELSIPSIGVSGLPVVPYQGSPDDAAGTVIQDQGVAASPHGPGGGVGPGEVGNYIVTAHRVTAGGPLRALPALREGATVLVTAGGVTYTYRISATRTTSFRSQDSMNAQRAPVPGSPGTAPTRAVITVTTCLTPEDDAAGNHWRDAQNNPEHRLDKIGVLTGTSP
ncbi:sortase [Streptomyces sp. NPDC032472]|uniref:sortase domain-containing protein n=1 Tax=Streptomyces sp. NPDC032472 TaxID=3155018 RepID=UPI0033F0AA2C